MAFQSKSLPGYNSVSSYQLSVSLKYLPDLISSLISSDSLCPAAIRLVDYGCSEGRNSSLVFSEALSAFRKTSDTPVEIIHTDLPDNSWSTVYHTINDSPESYLHLPNIFYSTLGRSFFNQLLPSHSVHLTYSTFAMHYLSQKQVRGEGDCGLIFPAIKPQAFADMRHLLGVRLEELVTGGILHMIVSGRLGQGDSPTGRILFGSAKKLMDRGVITREEFKNYVWHSYPYNVEEILEILEGFEGRIEVIKCEHGRKNIPQYDEYLETNDIEKFVEHTKRVMRVLMKNSFLGCLERSDEEKNRIFEIAMEEAIKALEESNEMTCSEYIFVVIKKIR